MITLRVEKLIDIIQKTFDDLKVLDVCTSDMCIFRSSLVSRISYIGEVFEKFPHIAYLPMKELTRIAHDLAAVDNELAVFLHKLRIMYNDLKSTVFVVDSKSRNGSFVRFQSQVLEMTGHESVGDLKVNEVFKDSTVSLDNQQMQLGYDEKEHGEISAVSISKFLTRPISIYAGQIAMGVAGAYLSIDPWTLWSSSPSVMAKLRNFAYFKGHVTIRIALSGTPFHFGRLLFSYQPYAALNTCLAYAQVEAPDGLLCYLSQAPGSFLLSVNTNQTYEITLPFIWQYNMLRLYNASSTVVSSYDDFAQMGKLYVATLGVVGSVSATPTSPYLQIYAWCDDAELGTSSATVINVPAESKVSDAHDERVTGPVERFASSMVNMLEPLRKVPNIGPYAMASSMMFTGAKHLASILGWSKPVPVNSLTYVKNEPYRNGANIIGLDTAHRITLDPLQEITVDQSCVESTSDDMSFNEICGRLSFYTAFKWNTTDVPLVPIFQQVVTPLVSTPGTIVSGNTFTIPTALCFAAMPFNYWHGDITYRVVINSSKFHRGKLMVFYEPNIWQTTLINAGIELNKNFQIVIDIAETSEFEFTVKWAKERVWMLVGRTGMCFASYTNTLHTFTPSSFYDRSNGYFGICPFTELQSPDDSPVYVNMFIKSDNMHFNGLYNNNADFSRGAGPADFVEAKAESQSYDVVPKYDLNESTFSDAHISVEYFGEEPFSFRSLLKRYVTIQKYANVATTHQDHGNYVGFEFPIIYANNSPASGPPIWGPSNDLLSYLRQAYVAMRGSMRQRISMYDVDGGTTPVQTQIRVGLAGISNTESAVMLAPPAQYSDSCGFTTFAPYTNNGVEVEFPFYCPLKFRLAYNAAGADTLVDQYWFRNYRVYAQMPKAVTNIYAIIDAATGEDFTLMRFQGSIPCYFAYV